MWTGVLQLLFWLMVFISVSQGLLSNGKELEEELGRHLLLHQFSCSSHTSCWRTERRKADWERQMSERKQKDLLK